MVMMLCPTCRASYKPPMANHFCKLYYYTEGEALNSKKYKRVDNIKDAHIMVVYGGDGTILRAIKKVVKENAFNTLNILGINRGHVGFLSNDIGRLRAATLLDSITGIKDSLSERSLLHVLSNNLDNYSLNDVVIQPDKRGKLFEVALEYNNEILTYKGDGVIISTASGSTAYNLSAGGPIIMPNMATITITPICPFSLSSRPIVLDGKYPLRITTKELANITIDGEDIGTKKLVGLEVAIASKTIKLVKINSFFNSIYNKLGWNNNIK